MEQWIAELTVGVRRVYFCKMQDASKVQVFYMQGDYFKGRFGGRGWSSRVEGLSHMCEAPVLISSTAKERTLKAGTAMGIVFSV